MCGALQNTYQLSDQKALSWWKDLEVLLTTTGCHLTNSAAKFLPLPRQFAGFFPLEDSSPREVGVGMLTAVEMGRAMAVAAVVAGSRGGAGCLWLQTLFNWQQ